MIERVTVDGREGFATWVTEDMTPVERDSPRAALIKVVFDNGEQLFLNAQSKPEKSQ
jgi:hypothetical protein